MRPPPPGNPLPEAYQKAVALEAHRDSSPGRRFNFDLSRRRSIRASATGPPHKPESLSPREAAALPLAAITAWEALVDRAQVRAGQQVLVHGGAGGVGQIAIQIARARGAEVFATGSARSLATIARLGATPIDYTTTPVTDYVAEHTGGEGFDVVFDTVGGATLDLSFTAVRTYTGHVVSALGWGTHSLAPLSFRGASYSGVFTPLPMLTGRGREHHGEILREVADLVDAGALKPLLDPRRFTLATVADAHAAVESGAATGKVVIDVEECIRRVIRALCQRRAGRWSTVAQAARRWRPGGGDGRRVVLVRSAEPA
ncbi:zinc-binding dehydrogenase [Dactylosporangium aurantiacum]|uniref:zinc-binding dehydrogenase n=1 Tax=Dactylosporangium aurantiacum TaxID=35754 RepID=UPI000A7AFA4B